MRLQILHAELISISVEKHTMSILTTLSGTPGGGKERFLGGGPLRYDLLSKRHSPIFP